MTIQRLAPQYYRSITSALVMMCVGLIASSCVWTNTVSVGISGEPGTGSSLRPAISGNGRYVAFDSFARNFVQGDTNAIADIFLRDTSSGTTTLISVSSAGTAANGHSDTPSISDDGRYIVYGSAASNLVDNDGNNTYDVFLYDRDTATTTRISVDSDGIEANAGSTYPQISADGRYVAFESYASNLVTGDANNALDVFVYDRTLAKIKRVTVNDQGDEANAFSLLGSLSDNGRYIAFSSDADNLVVQGSPFQRDIFVHDQTTSTTTLVSVDTAGNMGYDVSERASISGDGRFVSFTSRTRTQIGFIVRYDGNLVVHDRNSSTTSLISVPGHQHTWGTSPALSVDGRYVVFHSVRALEAGDTNNVEDIYAHDRNTGTTARVSLSSSGAQTDRYSQNATFSTDGRYVAFETRPIVSPDPNGPGNGDVVVRAFPALTVTSMVPSNLPVGATTPVTITGTHFLPGAIPRIEGGQFSDQVIVDESTMTANVTVPVGTPVATKDVFVDLHGTGPGPHAGAMGRCVNCVMLLPPVGC